MPVPLYSKSMTVDTFSESQSPDRKLQEDGVSTWDCDPRNPYNWPTWRKWLTMCISYWVTILVGINATAFTTPAEALSAEFNVDNSFFEFSFFAVTSWNFTAAVVPLATLPMMETFGFRIGYTVCQIAPVTKFRMLTRPGSVYSVLYLHHSAMCGAKLRNACGHPCLCRCFWRHCPERC